MNTKTLGLSMIEKYKLYLYNEERSQSTIEKYTGDILKFYDFLPADKVILKTSLILHKQSLNDHYKIASMNGMLVVLSYINLSDLTIKLY